MSANEIPRLMLITFVMGFGYATVDLLEHWSRFVVLGGIALTVAGTMIAISPARGS